MKLTHLEALFESMPEGIVAQDRAGHIVSYNPAALRILGLTADQLTGRSSFDPRWKALREDGTECPGEEHPAMVALRTGTPQLNRPLGVHLPSGELRWLAVSAVPIAPDEAGRATQVLATFRDVTEERAAAKQLEDTRRELEERERFLRATLGALPNLVSYVDRGCVYRYANAAYEEWFGSPASEWVGKTIEERLGAEAFALLKPRIERVLAGEELQFELVVPYRLGGTRSVQVTYLPDCAGDGRVRGYHSVVTDVTSLVEARHEVERRKHQLQQLLDGVSAMIGYWDRDLRNVHANRAYAEYFGREPERIPGMHLRDLLGPEVFEKYRPYVEAALRGEAQTFERELPARSGGVRQTLAQYIPNVGDDGVDGFFVVVTDISAIKRLEQQRQQIEAQLVAASRLSALGRMAAGISHEINNPLAIIRGVAAQLRERFGREAVAAARAQADLRKIEATCDRIAAIIGGLRTFAQDGERQPAQDAELGAILARTLELCESRIRALGIELRVRPAASALLLCRPTQVSQVILNLIQNAKDAVAGLAEKWIEIALEPVDGDRVRLRVTDSGPGIPPEVAARMMEPFFTTKDPGKGTGLGLSISKGIAEAHGGSLRYDPIGGHTSFVLELPAAPDPSL